MLARFSLYGFLKNQRYFEPFLVLAFLDKGLSFFWIGLLIAWREMWINLLEVPSGAIADVYGRRRAMIGSFAAYIMSFVLLGLCDELPLLFVAMSAFALGEAFRTGTHKAMIFSWLRAEGRLEERTRVYGYTRSWSKIGSAASVAVGALLVLATGRYDLVFLLSALPYLAGMVNFLGYPARLDGGAMGGGLRAVLGRLRLGLEVAWRREPVRRLLTESMLYEGLFRTLKDYLQPVLQGAALVMVAAAVGTVALDDAQQAALLVGPVYVALHLGSGLASRRAHRVVSILGGEARAGRALWVVNVALFGLMLAAVFLGWDAVVITAFVVLHLAQNVWRPVLIGRLDAHLADEEQATVLSIESQAKTLVTLALAPLIGWAVDLATLATPGAAFWPVAALGLTLSLAPLLLRHGGRT